MLRKRAALPCCAGNPKFQDPSTAFGDRDEDENKYQEVLKALNGGSNDFERAIKILFGLSEKEKDEYVYRAGVASVGLGEVQRAVEFGIGSEEGKRRLCDWYGGLNSDLKVLSPSSGDITAYTNIWSSSSSSSPAAALKSFIANAKKGSVRALVGEYLASKRFIHPDFDEKRMPKFKKKKKTKDAQIRNPYLDFWVWSCQVLGWCGPLPNQRLMGHHLLPVFMHHFGCVVPSHEALSVIKVLAEKKTVLDIGSGNGYWSWMLRNWYGVATVAVDNAQSEWRVNYLPSETICLTGTEYLASLKDHKDTIMMLVYPVVGNVELGTIEGSFTRDLMADYKGDTVVVVGTQNHNGYTGFKDMTFDEYMEREQKEKGWVRIVQIPLPSFAGKNDAMFVYQRGEGL
ncbi:hypothetical protein QBC38DRAFT_467394 [Podospora fimiseda]|uniref:Uncharacterized protein n=1 Tax=Podospora fimiseda TaxID=252190 RepID=A0AAN7BWQ8_9PEZI|nr:hypothetical protein QBC38DRAFT_467394 [Podospora fimiseda]